MLTVMVRTGNDRTCRFCTADHIIRIGLEVNLKVRECRNLRHLLESDIRSVITAVYRKDQINRVINRISVIASGGLLVERSQDLTCCILNVTLTVTVLASTQGKEVVTCRYRRSYQEVVVTVL